MVIPESPVFAPESATRQAFVSQHKEDPMCSVSAVMDYGQRTWPNTSQPNWNPLQPIQPSIQPAAEREAIKAFMDLVEKAKEFDKLADQPHCEDPEKIKLLERIERRLEALERAVGVVSND